MITVAIAEVFFFVEFNPLSAYTGGENGLPGVPAPALYLGFTTIHFNTDWTLYAFLAFWYFVGIVIALRIVRSPVGAVLRAIRDNPLRAAAVGHNIHGYKLTAFVVAAAYAGFAGGLLGVMQGFMPPDAFMFDTSGQLVMQTAIGGAGTLFGPLVGAAVWLYLSDFLQTTLHLGAAWKLVLGVIFVLLVCFLRRGLIGGIADLYELATGAGKDRGRRRCARPATRPKTSRRPPRGAARQPAIAAMPARHRETDRTSGPILQATGLTKHYGGLAANSDIDFTVNHGELRGIIGPNGAGKTTFFKMLTCEVPPTSGKIVFEGRDITGMTVTDVCQLGLTKSYQINQLFNRLTVRENLTIAALAELRGKFRLDLFRSTARASPASTSRSSTRSSWSIWPTRADTPVSELAYGEKRRLEVGLALATSPSLLLLDEPLAGMSPRERVETVRLLKSIARGRTMIIIDHDMDSLFELAERVTVLQEGRVLVEGTPDEIKGNAQGAGSLSRRRARRVGGRMSLLEVNGSEHLLRGLATSCSTSRCASSGTRWWRCSAATAPARARPEKPDGRGDAARRLGRCSTAPRSPARRATPSRAPACSWCTRTAASSAASTSRKTWCSPGSRRRTAGRSSASTRCFRG